MNRLTLVLCFLLPVVALGRDIDTFVVGGTTSNIASHPHQLSLRQGSHICGASLISATRAVTASHCIGKAASTYSVLAGTTDRTVTSCSTCQLRTCSMARRHPNYRDNTNGFPYDIAVLAFSAINTNSNVRYIQLATSNDGTFAGTKCVISGWGRTQNGGNLPVLLQQTYLTALTNQACSNIWYSQVGPAINAGHICVSAPNSGACQGDSGGPLVCNGKLAGATSWGSPNCNPYYPSVYTRVSYYHSWIIAQ